MINATSRLSASAYRHIIKPILFKQNPDSVHARMLRSGSVVQKLSLVTHLTNSHLAYKNNAMLGQKLAGIDFINPVGLAAGLDKNFEITTMLKAIGFGFMEGGSVTLHECAGNAKPWFYRLPKSKSLVVNVGLANHGIEQVIKRIKSYSDNLLHDFTLNISVAKTNSIEAASDKEAIADYVGSLQAIKTAGVGQMVTLNVSCPNAYGGEPFTTPDRLGNLLTAVDAVNLDQPVFIKLPCDLPWKTFHSLLQVADNHNITGLTISNLAKDRSAMKLQDKLPDSIKGNLSGKPTWELSNNLIRQTYEIYADRFIIIGVGGIFTAEDAYVKIKLGASLVELVTGLIFEGPQLIGEINKGLVELLHRDGFSNISQAIGVDVKLVTKKRLALNN